MRKANSNVAKDAVDIVTVDRVNDYCVYFDALPKIIREYLNYESLVPYSAKSVYTIYRKMGLALTMEMLRKVDETRIKDHYSSYKVGVMWVKVGIEV